MTYDELLDKWIRKLGRPCTAGEIVHDLRQLDMVQTDKDRIITLDELNAMQTTVSTDWVLVVRCKDCKHAEFSEAGMTYCPGIIGSWVEDDWFCADGERREDDAVSVED